MNIALRKISVLVLVMCLAASAWAENGVLIISKTKTLSNGKVSNSEIYLTQTKLMVKNSGADNSTIMFDGATEVFTYIDNNKKQYYEFDKPTLLQLKEQIKMMAKMMQQFAANMPEDQKKKFDRILNPDGQELIKYQANQKNDKIGKWKTTGYEGLSDDKKVLEMSLASYKTIGIEESKFVVMKQMMTYFRENLQEVVALLPTGGSLSQISFDENSPILKDGIPVKTISYEGGKVKNENVIDSIEGKNIDDSQFNIPAGYKRQSINLQSMGR